MKKTLRLLVLLMLVVTMCFAVVSCGDGEVALITNGFGAAMQGGGFDSDAVLNTEPLAADSAERANAIEKIVEYGVPLEQKAVAVYDIDATKDGVEVQPNGSVRVTIPAPIAAITSYDVFHISDNGSVDILNAVTADGKITFETSSFSTFLVASKLNVGDDVFANAPSYVAPYQTMKLGNATVNVNSMYQNYGNFKIGTDATEYFTYQTYTNAGEKITLTAIPNEGYEFVRWSKDGVTVSENATFEYTVTEGSNQLYAQFVSTTQYTIEIVNDGYEYFKGGTSINGGIAWGSASAKVDIGGEVTVRFIPEEGYRFVGLYKDLSGDPITTDTEYTFTATENVTLWARYEEIPNYLLSVTNDGYYYMRGRNVINGVSYVGEAGVRFNDGESITLEFFPYEGYRYVGLYDNDDNLITNESTYTFNITANTVYWVRYEEIPTYVLNVTNDGYYYLRGHHEINGKMYGGHTGIRFNDGDLVEMEFIPSEGYRYVGLYDNDRNLITTESEYTFNITADTVFWVRYEELPQYEFQLNYVGILGWQFNATATYTVDSSEKSISGSTINRNILAGLEVELSFSLYNEHTHRFLGWYDGYDRNSATLLSTEHNYTFTMDSAKQVYAHFEEIPKPTVIVDRFGGNDDTATIMCGGKQSAKHISVTLDPGATAHLTIIMNDDKYEFLGWYDATGVLLSDKVTYQVELTGDIYVFASVREKHNIKVRVDVNDYNAGWARDDASGKKYYAKEYKLYDDENATMTAIPKEGYGFAGWYVNGSCISSSLTLDVQSIGCDANVEARFYNLSNTAELTLSIYATYQKGTWGNGVYVNGVLYTDELCTVHVPIGSRVTIVPAPAEGYSYEEMYGYYTYTNDDEIGLMSTAEYSFDFTVATTFQIHFINDSFADLVPMYVWYNYGGANFRYLHENLFECDKFELEVLVDGEEYELKDIAYGRLLLPRNTEITVRVKNKVGYIVEDIKLDDQSLNSDFMATFTLPAEGACPRKLAIYGRIADNIKVNATVQTWKYGDCGSVIVDGVTYPAGEIYENIHEAGQSITLTAAPKEGYVIDHWNINQADDYYGQETIELYIQHNLYVYAVYKKAGTYELTVNVELDEGGGSISDYERKDTGYILTVNGVEYKGTVYRKPNVDGPHYYNEEALLDSSYNLEAEVFNENGSYTYRFLYWRVFGNEDSSKEYTFICTQDDLESMIGSMGEGTDHVEITAVFTIDFFNLEVVSTEDENSPGNYLGDFEVNGSVYGSAPFNEYVTGKVTLRAIPNEEQTKFIGWYIGADCISTELVLVVDMTENISIKAQFAPFENGDVVDIILSGYYQGWTDIRRSGNRYYVQIEQGLLPSDISELEIWGYIYDEDTNSGNGGIGEERKLDSAEYTIIGAEQFNPDLPGVYTVTYVCKERPYLYLTFTITVIESQAGMS